MRKLLSVLPLVAVLAAPAVMHADVITGQFSAYGDLTRSTTSLNFLDAYTTRNPAGITGSFNSLITTNEVINASSPTLSFVNYVNGSEVFTVGGLTITLNSFVQGAAAGMYNGTATLSATGYTSTPATVALTTQDNGTVTFSATTTASPVPEPSTLALLGTGGLGVAGAIRRRFRA